MKIMTLIIIKFFVVMGIIIYFLAIIMAKILFLVLGIILITAFYLIEKIILKKILIKEKKDEKIFLTAIALLTMASASVFGMYGVDSDWIDFLTHGNQFRARLEQLVSRLETML